MTFVTIILGLLLRNTIGGQLPSFCCVHLALIGGFTVLARVDAAENDTKAQPVGQSLVEIGLAKPEQRFYWPAENWCGVVAAYLVANDLDDPVSLAEVASEIPLSSAGASMLDLEDFFKARGFEVRSIDIDGPSLCDEMIREPSIRAIVFVQDRHWIALFGADREKVVAYDYPNWTNPTREEFEKMFHKKALIVYPQIGRSLSTWLRVSLVVLVSICTILILPPLRRKPKKVVTSVSADSLPQFWSVHERSV